jgi:hypothetical protein
MEEQKWYYEKLDEKGHIKYAPMNDADGKITGRHIFNLPAWFDENPEERKRLGWTKHIKHNTKDIEYDRATQYLINAPKSIDPYTVEDDWKIMTRSEEQMRLSELATDGFWGDDVITFGGFEV